MHDQSAAGDTSTRTYYPPVASAIASQPTATGGATERPLSANTSQPPVSASASGNAATATGTATELPPSASTSQHPAPASARALTSMKEIREEIIRPLMEQHPYLDGWHGIYVVEQAEHEILLSRVNWPRILAASYPQGKVLLRSVATFFPMELDPN